MKIEAEGFLTELELSSMQHHNRKAFKAVIVGTVSTDQWNRLHKLFTDQTGMAIMVTESIGFLEQKVGFSTAITKAKT